MAVIYPIYVGGVKCPICGGDMLIKIHLYMPCTFDFINKSIWSVRLKCLDCGFDLIMSKIYNKEDLVKVINRFFDEDYEDISQCIEKISEDDCIDPVYKVVALLLDYIVLDMKIRDPGSRMNLQEHYIELMKKAIKDIPKDKMEYAMKILKKIDEKFVYQFGFI